MKYHVLLPMLIAGLVLLCACGGKEPEQPEAGGPPMEITAFSFYHTASWAEDCYCLELTREEDGVRLYAEELFSGGRVAETMVDGDVLEQLGELAGTYHLEDWNGFQESDSHVLDGSSFSLDITLADASTISAHGNNSFPRHYSEVSSAVRVLYDDLMNRYAGEEG